MKLPTALHYFQDVTPSDVLDACPACKSDDVFAFDGDLFCNPCGWNSIESHVESQFAAMTVAHEKSKLKKETAKEKKTSASASQPLANTNQAQVA